MRSSAALFALLLLAACASPPPPPPPKPVLTGDVCQVRQAKGGTLDLRWDDAASMAEHEGLGATKPKVEIAWPMEDATIPEGKGLIQYRCEGFDVGTKADGQHCRIVLDNTGDASDVDHTATLEALNGGKPLAEGSHLLTIFPVRGSEISLKGPGACAQVHFHVKAKKGKLPDKETEQLIANLPRGTYDSSKGEAKNILCDVYIIGPRFDSGQHMKYDNVVATIEYGKERQVIRSESWRAFVLLKDPKPGTYKVTVALEERDDEDPIDAPFRETEREIVIK
jgi:hypothetical protein